MKNITIYCTASYYYDKQNGNFTICMVYNNKSKNIIGQRNNSTANRLVVEGMIEGVKRINEPCDIEFVTATNIGIKNLANMKGPHKDLMTELNLLLMEKQCLYTVTVTDKGGAWLKNKIMGIGRYGYATQAV